MGNVILVNYLMDNFIIVQELLDGQCHIQKLLVDIQKLPDANNVIYRNFLRKMSTYRYNM